MNNTYNWKVVMNNGISYIIESHISEAEKFLHSIMGINSNNKTITTNGIKGGGSDIIMSDAESSIVLVYKM